MLAEQSKLQEGHWSEKSHDSEENIKKLREENSRLLEEIKNSKAERDRIVQSKIV